LLTKPLILIHRTPRLDRHRQNALWQPWRRGSRKVERANKGSKRTANTFTQLN
jgi:hypothetical protein